MAWGNGGEAGSDLIQRRSLRDFCLGVQKGPWRPKMIQSSEALKTDGNQQGICNKISHHAIDRGSDQEIDAAQYWRKKNNKKSIPEGKNQT